tara:strand:+ start:25370 stop:26089 length:720 start_codon:yes stop_codon:yes gene_type:complete
MKIEGPLLKAEFVDRPNRFVTKIKINNQIINSHLPDPGRLKELLVKGARLYVRPAPNSSKRKTKFSTILVKHKNQLISLDSTLPNRFVKYAIINKELPMFKNFKLLRPEIPVGNHRFDFLLLDPENQKYYLEVKSVTFVDNKVAKFPDAVTERGKKHALALKKLVQKGQRAGILFVCQRSDAYSFTPMWERDYALAKAVFDAHSQGVDIWCITLNVNVTKIRFCREIPVNLKFVSKHKA